MTGKLRRGVLVTLAVAVAYAVQFIAIAAMAHLQLILAVNDKSVPDSLLPALYRTEIVFILAVLLVIASSVVPALVLQRLGIRSKRAYLATAVFSAPLAAYGFFFNAGTAFNIGAILEHVPDKPWAYQVPPFTTTLASGARILSSITTLEWVEWAFFAMVTVPAMGFGILCCNYFWGRIVQRAAQKND